MTPKLDLLLLNNPYVNDAEHYGVKAGARWPSIRSRTKTLQYYPFPFFMAYASALLKREGFLVRAWDAIAEGRTIAETRRLVIDAAPAAVLIETSSPSIHEDLALARHIKETLGSHVILAGPHATGAPAQVLQEPAVDLVVLGEYEETLLELLPLLLNGRDCAHVAGIACREGNADHGETAIRQNPRRALRPDLDWFPWPERDELPLHKYTDPSCKRYPNAVMITSRGCPYKCTFCVEPYIYYDHPSLRLRDPRAVVDEMEWLLGERGMREIYFDDTSLVVREAHVTALCEEMLRRNLRAYWSCMGDAKVSLATLKLMHRAGCRGMKFGLESSSPEVLRATKKPLKVQQAEEFVRNCRALGIHTHATYVFGLPGDTVERMAATLRFAMELNTTSSQFAAAVPLVGTPFYEQAVENGWLPQQDWSRFDGAGTTVLEFPELKPADVSNMLDEARRAKMRNLLRHPAALLEYLRKMYQVQGASGFAADLLKKGVFVATRRV